MLVALVAGLAIGAVTRYQFPEAVAGLLSVSEPVGTLWLNALRMTLIPLVVALLIGGIASVTDTGATGRLGVRTMIIFLVLLVGIGIMSALLAPPLLALLPFDPTTAATLREGPASGVADAARMPTFAQMITDIVPANPVRAAADGAMLPLVTFAVALGFAAGRLPTPQRQALVGFFRALTEAMLVIVGVVIRLAPIGVVALSIGLAARLGLTAVGAIAFYVVLLTGLVILATILLYPIAIVAGRVPPVRFARAVAPGQAVAFSARSSLAALPALVEAARTQLRLPPVVISFVFPLAVSTLRLSTPIMWAVTLPFLATLYSVDLPFSQLLWLIAVGILLSFSTPGLPSASLFLMVPFLPGLGIPAEALGIAIAADAIPDLFKSVLNVTGHMTSAVVAARGVPAGAASGVEAPGGFSVGQPGPVERVSG
jgi:Na+/H+-dicarboxylate symporter